MPIFQNYYWIYVCRLLGFTPRFITVWHCRFTGTLASTCAPTMYRDCYTYAYLCAKLFPLLDLFHDLETGQTWYHTCKQNNFWNAGMAILSPSLLSSIFPSYLFEMYILSLPTPSHIPLHITLLQCYPWSPCSLWELENTHTHTHIHAAAFIIIATYY